MRKKTHKPALLFFFILLMSALLVGSAAAKTEADNPCDGPYKDTAKKYGVPCPEVKNEKPENRQSEKSSLRPRRQEMAKRPKIMTKKMRRISL